MAERRWLWAAAALTACGFAVAIALAPPAGSAPGIGLAWPLFLGSSVHVASTGWLYSLPEVRRLALRRPARYLWAPGALVLGGAAVAAVLAPPVLTWLLLPYFAWQFHHFGKQNLGLVALAGPLTRADRRILVASSVAGTGGLVAHPALLQLHVDPRLGWLFPLCALGYAAVVVTGVAMTLRRPGGFRVLYLMALLFWLPVFVFVSPYAAVAGMTIAHGLQYLLMVALATGGGGSRRLAVGCNVVLLGGAVLAFASHLHDGAPLPRALFGAYLGVVMAHFVIDARIWRRRDGSPLRLPMHRAPI